MTWFQILTLIGIPTLGSLLVTYIFNAIINGKKAKESRMQEFATTVEKENYIIKKALQALLRDRLYELYYRCMEKGYATLTEKHNFENMYNQYHALGANGVMDNVRDDFINLPTPVELQHQRSSQEGE